jgi:hypothetical protein
MATQDLRKKYGNGKQQQVINAAIRAEIPGGAEVLDLMELTHHAGQRLGWREADGRPSILQVIHDRLRVAAEAMESEIRRRYGMPAL